MFHVDIMPVVTCFAYTLYHFHTFSGTNLLIRCHSVSSCFLLFFRFRKVLKEIFSKLDENRRALIFHRDNHGDRRRAGEAPEGTLTRARRGPTFGRSKGWCGPPRGPPMLPLRLYNPPTPKTLRTRIFSMKSSRAAAVVKPYSGGFLKLFSAPCRRGDQHRRALHHHACLRSDA